MKKQLSKTEHNLILVVPLVRRLRPIIIQPQTVFVPFQIENFRVAIAVGYMRSAIYITARLKRDWAVFYSGARLHQRRTPSFFFFKTLCISSTESRSHPRSQYTKAGKALKSLDLSMQPIQVDFTKNFLPGKALKQQKVQN